MHQVGCVGSGTFQDRTRAFRELDEHRELLGDFLVVSGGAEGADKWAALWAAARRLPFIIYKAEWRTPSPSGKADFVDYSAGFERNKLIVADSDMVFAWWDRRSNGTRDTLFRAWRAGKPIICSLFETSEERGGASRYVTLDPNELYPRGQQLNRSQREQIERQVNG